MKRKCQESKLAFNMRFTFLSVVFWLGMLILTVAFPLLAVFIFLVLFYLLAVDELKWKD